MDPTFDRRELVADHLFGDERGHGSIRLSPVSNHKSSNGANEHRNKCTDDTGRKIVVCESKVAKRTRVWQHPLKKRETKRETKSKRSERATDTLFGSENADSGL